MDWLNLHTSTLDSPEVVGADPRARATWLFLLRYCVGQENGGLIRDCASWGDRKWQQAIRVTKREVAQSTQLWRWEGGDLRVNFYPTKKEKEVQAKREGGRLGGQARTEAKIEAARLNGGLGGRPATYETTEAEPKLKPNGMEGNGREVEGEWARAKAELPESLKTDPVIEVWIRWKIHYASEFNHGNDMAPGTVYQQTKDLVSLGPRLAVLAIENALSNGKLKKPCLPFGPTSTPQPHVRLGQNLTEGAA